MEPRPAGRRPAACHPQTMRNMHGWGDIATIERSARRANMVDNVKRYAGTVTSKSGR